LRVFVLISLLATLLAAALNLKQEYYYDAPEIRSTLLFPQLQRDFVLFEIPESRNRMRVEAEALVSRFAAEGIAVAAEGVRYVNFIRKSPVDTQPIAAAIAEHYRLRYPTISIASVDVVPRVYTPSLPAPYSVSVPENSYRGTSGTVYVTLEEGRRSFFDYTIEATVGVRTAQNDLRRDEVPDVHNTSAREVPLRSLEGEPLTDADLGHVRLKRLLRAGEVILQRFAEPLPLVRRDATVEAVLHDGNVLIQFYARALQDGVLHDMIPIEKPDGQRLEARIVGENKVQIE